MKKTITYGSYKNILNRVGYKLVKQGKKYKHAPWITINKKTVTSKEIKSRIKQNGKNYKKDEYISRFVEDVVLTNDKTLLPGYVLGSSGVNKYNRASYRAMVKTVTDYRKKHGKNPSKIKVKYEKLKIYKKYGHATVTGCDNKGQNTPYYCGCHSIQEVIRNLTGKVIKQSTIASVAGTTTSGTDHDGLNTVIAWFNRKYGYNLKVQWLNFSDIGWKGIRNIINSDNQDAVIHNLYRNQYGHYEVINKVYDDNIKVQNSLGDKCNNGCYCGYTEDRTPSTFKSYINGISQKSIMVITNES